MDLLHQWQREAPLAQRLTNGAPEVSARALPLVPRLPGLALTLDAAIPWALACSASQAARLGGAEGAVAQLGSLRTRLPPNDSTASPATVTVHGTVDSCRGPVAAYYVTTNYDREELFEVGPHKGVTVTETESSDDMQVTCRLHLIHQVNPFRAELRSRS